VRLERGAADLRRQQVIDLVDAGRVVELDLEPDRAVGAGGDVDLVDRRRGQRVDPDPAGLERDPRSALRHVQGIGDPDHPRLERVRHAAAPVADDRVQRLGNDDRSLRLLVDVGEEVAELALNEEQAVGLVVRAVDRQPDVVEQRPRRDHHLGVAVPHPVVDDHRRRDVGPGEQAQQAQRHVEHDLDVDPRVVGHLQPLGGHLRHVPPRPHLLVGVDSLQQGLEAAVAARRSSHPRLVDRFGGRLALRGAGSRRAGPVRAQNTTSVRARPNIKFPARVEILM
jgi:hypothetical protein